MLTACGGFAGPAHAAAKATIVGAMDDSLQDALAQAVGESKTEPETALVARRRAREAAAAAVALLRSEGYYEASVEADISETKPFRSLVKVVPGPRFQIAGARIAWSGPAPDAASALAAAQALHLAAGSAGRAPDILAAEGSVVSRLQARGYADALVQPREVIVDHADHTVRPTFNIQAGAQVRLGAITVVTRGRTQENWLRRLAPWNPGDVYRPEQVAKLERRLDDTGVYEAATVSLSPLDPAKSGLRSVMVNLADRPGHTLELGAGYSTTQGSGAEAKFILYNRLGRADTLTFTTRAYDIQQKLDAEWALPHWRRPDQTLRVGAGVVADRTAGYDDTGGGLRIDLVRHFTKTTFITVGAAADYAATREKIAVNLLAAPVGVNLRLFVVTGLGAFALDRSNDPLNPTHGWRLEARIEPTAIEGDRRLLYLKTLGQASYYLPLPGGDATVLAGRVKLGAILGGAIPQVPADRRFFAGGGASVRGYGYQAVGPRLSDNTPQGGLSLVEASLEVRRRISRNWGFVAFVDAGAVGTTTTPSLNLQAIGAGVGVRYDLGFGPFRVDLATPINRRKGDAPIQVSVSIGQSF